ncbi:MAG: HAMP domain-containing histidine kinase [Chloroflexi bacterium]|uniref:histidine kinase n=1 Tax=Candidatus Chlorohelix allophototropha TaxID=3003348 RepID=A0A8T7M444_9CHLR|nr:HAMP domain-containing histidine kinase [Chloroflexota bacterium]
MCAVVVILVGLVAYSLHARGHYDELDRLLVANAEHAAADSMNFDHPLGGADGTGVGLLLYNLEGKVELSSPDAELFPTLSPIKVLASPAGAAFDPVAGLAPSLSGSLSQHGGFGLISTPNQRWRVYVLPLEDSTSYIETVTSLGKLDASMQTFRLILLFVGLLGVSAALIGARLLAGRALQPVSKMIQAAQTISHSRDFSHRLEVPLTTDELGRLADTFNEMLQNLEGAYQAQQRFVSDASHELRAPLTAIQGNLELLRRQRYMSEEEREEAFSEAERETERLTRLVADLLVLARADSGSQVRHGTVDLDEVVLEAFKEARKLAYGHSLTLEELEPVQLEGDRDRLKQLVLILLDNALKYTPESGAVILSLENLEGQANLTVRDNGVGIAEQELAHVFERFYRADPARGRDPGGTGLGLPIARWVVQQHSGTITLTSVLEQGTTVLVALPVKVATPLATS